MASWPGWWDRFTMWVKGVAYLGHGGVMSRDFREVDRETAWLLPPSVQDWLPEDHLARFVVEIVDSLDLGRLTSALGHGVVSRINPAAQAIFSRIVPRTDYWETGLM